MIQDSGDRTEFGTGAVRDMHEGKGRFDLMPWEALLEVAKHCEEGAKKYGEHNVDKGIPVNSFVDSAFRHLAKFTSGWEDEDHLRAAAWNVLWALQMTITHPELVNVPYMEEWQKMACRRQCDNDCERCIYECSDCAYHERADTAEPCASCKFGYNAEQCHFKKMS